MNQAPESDTGRGAVATAEAPARDGPQDNETTGPAEQAESEARRAPSATVVHNAILSEGEDELGRPTSALLWSGLAAGLSMGFSLVGVGLLQSHLPDAPWRPLVAELGYSLGFLIVILGRQQLFTENTLTAVLPVLDEGGSGRLLQMLRLWTTVLAANLAGALLFAVVVAHTSVFEPDVQAAFSEIGRKSIEHDPPAILLTAIFAGWLIALIVWVLPFAEAGKVAVIVILTYVVALGGFAHVIAGSVDVLYLVVTGQLGALEYLGGFLLPTLVGNTIGGVALVAALNHAQVSAGSGDGT
jgi:formate/nitrite transporter FocA (FNT family)